MAAGSRGLVPMRTTHTYSRQDVAEAVQREAFRRGCTTQDVVNDILAQVLIDGAISVRDRQITSLQHAIDVLARQGSPVPPPTGAYTPSVSAPVGVSPPPGVRVTTLAAPSGAKNFWEA